MSTIKFPWTMQPQGVVGVNWNNPIAKNLAAAGYSIGGTLYEATTNSYFPNISCTSNPPKLLKAVGSPGGMTCHGDGVNLRALPNRTLADDIISAPMSVFCEFTPVQGKYVPIIASYDSVNSYGWGLRQDDYQFAFNSISLMGNSNTKISNTTTDSLGVLFYNYTHRVAVTLDGSNSYFYGNGGKLLRTVAANPSFTANTSRRLIVTGDYSGKVSTLGVSCFLVFSRCLSQAEVISLSMNPWQIFAS